MLNINNLPVLNEFNMLLSSQRAPVWLSSYGMVLAEQRYKRSELCDVTFPGVNVFPYTFNGMSTYFKFDFSSLTCDQT